jgi:hypothetical protein
MQKFHRDVRTFATLILLVAMGLFCRDVASQTTSSQPPCFGKISKVAIVADQTRDAPSRYGVRKLEEALRSRAIEVSESADAIDTDDCVLLAGLVGSHGPAADILTKMKVPLPGEPESLAIRTNGSYRNKPAIVLLGFDGPGLMYAALDIAGRIAWTGKDQNPFLYVRNASEKPFLKDRGVVIFTMNRAYFESRLYDEQFWIRYFDMFAKDRINKLVLTFGYEDGGYMAPPYPYFFNVDGFPDVKVVGLSPEQQKKNYAAFKNMLRLASERGIRVKPGIWDHIYRGGGQAGAISWASNGKQPTPGLVWGLNSSNLVPYTVAALKKFYEIFPEIKETQFRMHNESGLTEPEIEPFWHDVFNFYSKDRRDIALELRAKGLDKAVIKDAQSQALNVHLDTKIWMEQMGLPYHPTHINKEDQNNARQSYADLLEYPQTYSVNWTLWNGGTQRVLEWADPEYARRMVEDARLYNGPGLAVTEMEATKMLGDSPDAPARDFINSKYKYFDYEFERYWAFYRMWGRLSYNPQASSDLWEREYAQRFGDKAGPHVMNALQLASRVLPRVTAASVPYKMFPTTTGWPEMMRPGSLPQFAAKQEGSDIAQFENVREEAASILAGTDTAMRRPQETSRWFAQTSAAILGEVATAEKSLGGQAESNDFKATLADAKILAALARYHSWRLLAGVDYNLYKQAGSLAAFDDAIQNERKAIQSWREAAEVADELYSDNMVFGASERGFPHHWKDELPAMESEFKQLLAERQAATTNGTSNVVVTPMPVGGPTLPSVKILPVEHGKVVPGEDIKIGARVVAPAGIKWIRLRYRHVNQKEDYQSVDMLPGGKADLYEARIPGSFVTPQWDVMYYIEIVDKRSNGRIYPDLERETPYVVLNVKR